MTAGTIGDCLVPYASALGRPRRGEEMFPGAETLPLEKARAELKRQQVMVGGHRLLGHSVPGERIQFMQIAKPARIASKTKAAGARGSIRPEARCFR